MLCLYTQKTQDYAWRDYVRGKDLQKFLKGKQELLDQFTKPQAAGEVALKAL